jgi:hypothetical protein
MRWRVAEDRWIVADFASNRARRNTPRIPAYAEATD